MRCGPHLRLKKLAADKKGRNASREKGEGEKQQPTQAGGGARAIGQSGTGHQVGRLGRVAEEEDNIGVPKHTERAGRRGTKLPCDLRVPYPPTPHSYPRPTSHFLPPTSQQQQQYRPHHLGLSEELARGMLRDRLEELLDSNLGAVQLAYIDLRGRGGPGQGDR